MMLKSLDRRMARFFSLGCGVLLFAAAETVVAQGGVSFVDVAAGGANGLVYQRAPSARKAAFDQIVQQPVINVTDLVFLPMKAWGAPGVALFDYDGDSDLDIYVTNGPGAANSLFSNQLAESGEVSFVDVGTAAGVGAVDQDSQGVCFGDVDNDGDHDLLVLGAAAPNRLFENQGNGTFEDVTAASGIGGGDRTSTSCSMGDVNGDGLLDVVVANAYEDWSNQLPYAGEPFVHNEHNQLFLNTGGNVFTDVSAASGIEAHAGLDAGTALLTWAIALVDYDLDGDVDVMTADDQTVVPPAQLGGLDVGFIRVFQNDGTGQFTDVTFETGMNRFGAWMGLSYGDFNCDGLLDVFGTNFGDYALGTTGLFQPGEWSSRWFLGQADGTFADPGVGDLLVTPFGWGTSVADYDNDGASDIVFHGGFNTGTVVDASNPGVILRNQGCSAAFTLDTAALAGSTDHVRRSVQGMALGDLDDDGFVDVVSVSGLDIPEAVPLFPYPALGAAFGSVFDPTAFLLPVFFPTEDPTQAAWGGVEFANGTLSVELSSGNGNRWVTVDVMGSVGLTSQGRVNRDGIGAVVTFTPAPGRTRTVQPVLGGSSYASQDSLRAHFGLGEGRRGKVDVLWPGGVRNRLYTARLSEQILFPEIPCDFTAEWEDAGDYVRCVSRALGELGDEGVLDPEGEIRFLLSAIRAYLDERGLY